MCTLVILRRPTASWPVLIAANRDEMADRPWRPPARHWPDRAQVIGGLDELAGGTWLGRNDDGVVAAVLNRIGTLGPAAGKRSRGELVLDALDHADAADAAANLAHIDPAAYRPFNLVIADNRDAWCVMHRGDGPVQVVALPAGLSMITARDPNDTAGARIGRFLPQFRAAAVPDPDRNRPDGDWSAWQALLADRSFDPATPGPGPERGAMCFLTPSGFGTTSSSLLALPAIGADRPPVWLFAAGPPDRTPWQALPPAGPMRPNRG